MMAGWRNNPGPVQRSPEHLRGQRKHQFFPDGRLATELHRRDYRDPGHRPTKLCHRCPSFGRFRGWSVAVTDKIPGPQFPGSSSER